MYHERVELTAKDIYDKDFKIDTRGYRPQEVDRFLDTVIKDYDEFIAMIEQLEAEKKQLLTEIVDLKKEVRTLRTKIDVISENEAGGATGANADLLRRLSNLEKIIYGKE
jgi:DivIVA domain-containing protein